MAFRSRWHARTGKVTARFADGNSITLEPTEGNLSIGGMNAGNFENVKVLNRLQHDGFVEGTDLVQDVSIDLQMPREIFTSAFLRPFSFSCFGTRYRSAILSFSSSV